MESGHTVTPSVLVWARESIGYTIDEVVFHLKANRVTSDVVTAWEEGFREPSYSQLKKLSKFYKRPVALFFFPEPPEEESMEGSFKSIPFSVLEKIPPNVKYMVRLARARQMDLNDLYAGQDISPKIFSFSFDINEDPFYGAKIFRIFSGIGKSSDLFYGKSDFSFEQWRALFIKLGVWVFKERFKHSDCYGFSLYNKQFPVIYINNAHSFECQIFTLFYELGHLLFRKGGFTFRNRPVFEGDYKKLDVFCDSFANSFLFNEGAKTSSFLLKKGGGYYYRKLDCLGFDYVRLVFSACRKKIIKRSELSEFLDIREGDLEGLKDMFDIFS